MKNQCVTKEIAERLEKLGFDEVSEYNYSEVYGFVENINGLKHSDGNNRFVSAPLWQEAIDWLDEMGVIVEITKDNLLRNIENKTFTYTIYTDESEKLFNSHYKKRATARKHAIEDALAILEN